MDERVGDAVHRSYHGLVEPNRLVVQSRLMEGSLCLLAELGCGLHRIGCQYHLLRCYLVVAYRIRQPVCQGICLAASGTCTDIFYVPHRYFLLKIS